MKDPFSIQKRFKKTNKFKTSLQNRPHSRRQQNGPFLILVKGPDSQFFCIFRHSSSD